MHYFYNDRWQILETRDSTVENTGPESLQPVYQYVWSIRYIDAVAQRMKNTDSDGLCDDETLYYLSDANFNVTCLLNQNATVLERYAYDPYGKVRYYDGSWSTRSTSSYNNSILYTGREYDAETGLYHYRHRYYHGELGRFIGRDPMGFLAGEINLYRYVYDNPAIFVDPSGLQGAGAPTSDPGFWAEVGTGIITGSGMAWNGITTGASYAWSGVSSAATTVTTTVSSTVVSTGAGVGTFVTVAFWPNTIGGGGAASDVVTAEWLLTMAEAELEREATQLEQEIVDLEAEIKEKLRKSKQRPYDFDLTKSHDRLQNLEDELARVMNGLARLREGNCP